jgi:hypothetical protein
VGGTVALVVAIALAWFLGFRHKRGSSKESIDHNSRSPQPFNSNASPNAYGTPTNAPTQSDRAPLAIQISRSNFTETTSTSMPSTGYPQGSDRTSRKLQVTNQTIARPPTSPSHTGRTRALPTTPPLDSPPMIEQQSSRTSHAQSASVSSQDRDPPSQDMNTLAREVAAVIMQNAAGGRSSGDEAPPSYAAHN